jgi:hypothetical protein
MLQWKESIITEDDIRDGAANSATVESYEELASRLEAI